MNGKFNAGGLLSMCRRAGKLCMGMDAVKGACYTGEAAGVYVATDLSEKSLKEVKYVCYKNSVRLYDVGLTMQEIGESIGKRAGILAICDGGFNKKARSELEEIATDGIGDAF